MSTLEFRRSTLAACVVAGLAMGTGPAVADPAKNVFLLIADGASWGTWDMASYWEHGELGKQPYDSFDVKLGMTTHSASVPSGYEYDWSQAWDVDPVDSVDSDGRPNQFAGYEYIKQNATDSAAAGTALSSGVRTLNGRIGVDADGNPVKLITHKATAAGKSTGVVSSVQWTHATPAAFGAQNISRGNYGEISRQMISDDSIHLDVIMGAGHPEYDGDSQPLSTPRYNRIASDVWSDLKSGSTDFTLIEERADFEALADGTYDSGTLPARVVGTAKTNSTLQLARSAAVQGEDASNPTGVAFNEEVPSLATMTKGAINVLSQNDEGFFLMVEGGAVDWAAHGMSTEGIIEEQVAFNHSVLEVVNWVEGNGGWDENLVLVVTDHGNAMPMGPDSDSIAFQPIQNNGKGVLPGVTWHYDTHTTENTLMWAMGDGADALYSLVDGYDFGLRYLDHNGDGAYIDIVDVFPAVEAAVVPVPASVLLLGSALIPLAARMRRKAA